MPPGAILLLFVLSIYALLVAWGVLSLKRSPAGQRGPGVVPAGVGLAFAALA